MKGTKAVSTTSRPGQTSDVRCFANVVRTPDGDVDASKGCNQPLIAHLSASVYQNASVSHDIEILITLSHRQRGIRSKEFVAEDLCEEDIVGDVFGFEHVATDGAVG